MPQTPLGGKALWALQLLLYSMQLLLSEVVKTLSSLLLKAFQISSNYFLLHRHFKLPNMGRKLKQSFEIPILARELYVFIRKDLCFGTGRKSFAKYFLSEHGLNSAFLRSILVAKIISLVIFDTDHSFKR